MFRKKLFYLLEKRNLLAKIKEIIKIRALQSLQNYTFLIEL